MIKCICPICGSEVEYHEGVIFGESGYHTCPVCDYTSLTASGGPLLVGDTPMVSGSPMPTWIDDKLEPVIVDELPKDSVLVKTDLHLGIYFRAPNGDLFIAEDDHFVLVGTVYQESKMEVITYEPKTAH